MLLSAGFRFPAYGFELICADNLHRTT